jgi:hypothetical protein
MKIRIGIGLDEEVDVMRDGIKLSNKWGQFSYAYLNFYFVSSNGQLVGSNLLI